MKNKIAKWYKQGLWSAEMVQNAVKKGILTEADAAEILNN
ncbi:XkdX family protein [Anaerotignum sp.]